MTVAELEQRLLYDIATTQGEDGLPGDFRQCLTELELAYISFECPEIFISQLKSLFDLNLSFESPLGQAYYRRMKWWR